MNFRGISPVSAPLLSFLVLAALAGCLSSRRAPEDAGGGALENGSLSGLVAHEEYRLNQRLTLTVGSKVYYFQGVVAVRKPSWVRAQAFGELGGRFVDLLVRPEGGTVLFQPEPMPPKPLAEGVLGDLAFLYLPSSSEVVRDAAGDIVSARQHTGARLEREARFEGYQALPSFEGKRIPTQIHLRNRRWHYRLDIETLSLHLGPIPEKVFSVSTSPVAAP